MSSGDYWDIQPRILVVEDDDEMRMLLSDELTEEGCRVWQAENGEVAADAVFSGAFDLIITDLQMPKMNGLDLLTFLFKWDPTLPVIVMTAFDNDVAQQDWQKRVFATFRKPVKMPELKLVVRAALRNP